MPVKNKIKKKVVKSKIISTARKSVKLPGKVKRKNIKKRLQAKKVFQREQKKKSVELERISSNPIIEPRPYTWESKATFNPSAFLGTGKVHLIYRAIGEDDSSVLGYAGSTDGYNIDERPTYAVYRRYNDFSRIMDENVMPIDYVSGGGWNGGCEDPRLTRIGSMVYMLYTAFDGWGSVRISLTSIPLEDFEQKKWNWKNPVLISPPNEIHKNWVMFPEKIYHAQGGPGGNFAILPSLSPRILIDYFSSLDELDGKTFIHSVHQGSREWQLREKGMRGVGPAPIKTELGWLVLYHRIEEHDPNRYKIFAMILDLKNPAKILYRSESPILEPEEYYENNGYKWGVVYSCGAVVKSGVLFVYYGGADRVVGVASLRLADLLSDLKKHKVAKFKKHFSKI